MLGIKPDRRGAQHGFLPLLLLLASCGPSPGRVWLRHPLAGHVEVVKAPAATSMMIWRQGKMAMTVRGQGGLEALRRAKGQNQWLMVDAPKNTNLARLLAKDQATLAYIPDEDGASVHALVAVPDTAALDDLARAAHAAGGGVCGNLAVINLNLIATPVPLTPPVYLEAINLGNAQPFTSLSDQDLVSNLSASIRQLESQGTRFHSSASGQKTPALVQQMLTDAAGGKIANLKAAPFKHQTSTQSSVVLTIPGSEDPQATGPVVIIGAHLDSINALDHTANAPGADDDASGIATLVEVVRAIANSGATFKRTIELHAYAAEEVGLYGSAEMASSYSTANRRVAAMLQVDMNSWSADAANQIINLVITDTSATLRRSLKSLLTTYLGGNYAEKILAHGTSDHRSWSNAGFPVVFPFEDPSNYNAALHTPRDTSTTINNLPLTARFVKMALLFLTHHAGLSTAQAAYDQSLAAWRQATPKDLKLAITQGSDSDTYFVTVAGPATLKTVELCRVDTPGTTGCVREVVSPNPASGNNTARAYFSTSSAIGVAADVHIAIFGYDAADKLVGQRSVHLTKK